MGEESLNILHARDISPSGLGVHVPHGFDPSDLGSVLDLIVTLPGGRSFMAKGVVRHREHVDSYNLFGVEFTELKPVHREEIRRFIGRLASLEGRTSSGGDP